MTKYALKINSLLRQNGAMPPFAILEILLRQYVEESKVWHQKRGHVLMATLIADWIIAHDNEMKAIREGCTFSLPQKLARKISVKLNALSLKNFNTKGDFANLLKTFFSCYPGYSIFLDSTILKLISIEPYLLSPTTLAQSALSLLQNENNKIYPIRILANLDYYTIEEELKNKIVESLLKLLDKHLEAIDILHKLIFTNNYFLSQNTIINILQKKVFKIIRSDDADLNRKCIEVFLKLLENLAAEFKSEYVSYYFLMSTFTLSPDIRRMLANAFSLHVKYLERSLIRSIVENFESNKSRKLLYPEPVALTIIMCAQHIPDDLMKRIIAVCSHETQENDYAVLSALANRIEEDSFNNIVGVIETGLDFKNEFIEERYLAVCNLINAVSVKNSRIPPQIINKELLIIVENLRLTTIYNPLTLITSLPNAIKLDALAINLYKRRIFFSNSMYRVLENLIKSKQGHEDTEYIARDIATILCLCTESHNCEEIADEKILKMLQPHFNNETLLYDIFLSSEYEDDFSLLGKIIALSSFPEKSEFIEKLMVSFCGTNLEKSAFYALIPYIEKHISQKNKSKFAEMLFEYFYRSELDGNDFFFALNALDNVLEFMHDKKNELIFRLLEISRKYDLKIAVRLRESLGVILAKLVNYIPTNEKKYVYQILSEVFLYHTNFEFIQLTYSALITLNPEYKKEMNDSIRRRFSAEEIIILSEEIPSLLEILHDVSKIHFSQYETYSRKLIDIIISRLPGAADDLRLILINILIESVRNKNLEISSKALEILSAMNQSLSISQNERLKKNAIYLFETSIEDTIYSDKNESSIAGWMTLFIVMNLYPQQNLKLKFAEVFFGKHSSNWELLNLTKMPIDIIQVIVATFITNLYKDENTAYSRIEYFVKNISKLPDNSKMLLINAFLEIILSASEMSVGVFDIPQGILHNKIEIYYLLDGLTPYIPVEMNGVILQKIFSDLRSSNPYLRYGANVALEKFGMALPTIEKETLLMPWVATAFKCHIPSRDHDNYEYLAFINMISSYSNERLLATKIEEATDLCAPLVDVVIAYSRR